MVRFLALRLRFVGLPLSAQVSSVSFMSLAIETGWRRPALAIVPEGSTPKYQPCAEIVQVQVCKVGKITSRRVTGVAWSIIDRGAKHQESL